VGTGLCNSAEAIDVFPVEGCPRRRICFEGRERDVDTESRIDDQRFSGGASGVDERELSMILSISMLVPEEGKYSASRVKGTHLAS
jgi:hypothetical protein